MAFDFKTATPDATLPSTGYLFGADSQSATDSSIYPLANIIGGSSGQWQYNNAGVFGGMAGTGRNGTTNTPYSTYGIDIGNKADGSQSIPAGLPIDSADHTINIRVVDEITSYAASPQGWRINTAFGNIVSLNATSGTDYNSYYSQFTIAKIESTDTVTNELVGMYGTATTDSSNCYLALGGYFYSYNTAATSAAPYVAGSIFNAYNSGASTNLALSGGAFGSYNTGACVSQRQIGGEFLSSNTNPSAGFTSFIGLQSELSANASATYTDAVNLLLLSNLSSGDAIRSKLNGTTNWSVRYDGMNVNKKGIDSGNLADGTYTTPSWYGAAAVGYNVRSNSEVTAKNGQVSYAGLQSWVNGKSTTTTPDYGLRAAEFEVGIDSTDTVTTTGIGVYGSVQNFSSVGPVAQISGLFFETYNYASTANGALMSGASANAYNFGTATNAIIRGLSALTWEGGTGSVASLIGIQSTLSSSGSTATIADACNILLNNDYSGGDAIRSKLSGVEKFAVDYLGNVRLYGDIKPNGNIASIRNSTTAQELHVYNTYTNASNYERGVTRWSSNVFEIGAQNAGTGTLRDIKLIGSGITLDADTTVTDAKNIILGSTTGTKIGTATTQKLGFFNATPVVQPAALTSTLTSLTHTAPGTPDYAIQDLTDVGGFGFVTKDEGNTVLSVILNLQTRVNGLETKLQALGLLA